MLFDAYAIQDGLGNYAIQTLTIVHRTRLFLGHVTTLEQMPALMGTSHIHAFV